MAVLSFVGAAFNLLQIAGLGFMIYAKSHPDIVKQIPDQQQRDRMAEAIEATPRWYLHTGIAVDLGFVALLIVVGMGYLALKRRQGWLLGNVWAVSSIAVSALQLIFLHAPFGIMTFVNFLFPLVTLLALNTTFRQDFVNP
jgi:hypothetical protein